MKKINPNFKSTEELKKNNNRTTRLEAEIYQSPNSPAYRTVLAYARIMRLTLSAEKLRKLGIKASRLSRSLGVEIRKIPDERWGFVGSYRDDILFRVFVENVRFKNA